MENPIKMDDFGFFLLFLVQHPHVVSNTSLSTFTRGFLDPWFHLRLAGILDDEDIPRPKKVKSLGSK